MAWPALLGLIGIFAGCAAKSDTRAIDEFVVRVPSTGSLAVEFPHPPADLRDIRVLDRNDRLLRETQVEGTRRVFAVPFVWTPGVAYRVECRNDHHSRSVAWTAPAERGALTAAVEAPAGQDPVAVGERPLISALAGADRQVSIALTIVNGRQIARAFEWSIRPPEGMRLIPSDENWKQTDRTWTTRGELNLEHQSWRSVVQVELPAGSSSAELEIRFGQRGVEQTEVRTQTIGVAISLASPSAARDFVSVTPLVFPTDAHGGARPEQASDEVALPQPVWAKLLAWLRPAGNLADQYAEFGWQATAVTNRSPYPLNLAIDSSVHSVGGGEPLLSFAPPTWKAPRETAVAEHWLRLAPGETAPAILPVYVRDDARPGDYQRHVRLRLAGTDLVLAELTAPLTVTRGNSIAALVVIASLASVAVAWCLTPWAWPRIVRRFSVEQMTTIALLSGAHFMVAYVSRLGADLVAALTGPFAVFLAGIGNEGITSALVAALLVLAPRVGTLTLSSLTVFLLQAMFTGQMGLVDLLMVTVSILIQEALLFGFGITRNSLTMDRPGLRERLTFNFAMRMALAIGLGNALALYAQFCLATTLYRLYFATWYIAAVALVTGLLYGALGAASGAALGFQLRRTAR